jgi:hypothetical protein
MSLPAVSSAYDSDSASPLSPAEAQALLRVGFERFQKKLQELVTTAIEGTDDLFEATSHIPDGESRPFARSTAKLVVKPVPLWNRAVSSALDLLAARTPAGRPGTAPRAPIPA